METNGRIEEQKGGQTDGANRITSHANAVGNQNFCSIMSNFPVILCFIFHVLLLVYITLLMST